MPGYTTGRVGTSASASASACVVVCATTSSDLFCSNFSHLKNILFEVCCAETCREVAVHRLTVHHSVVFQLGWSTGGQLNLKQKEAKVTSPDVTATWPDLSGSL